MITDSRVNDLVDSLAKNGTREERLLIVNTLTWLPVSAEIWRGAAASILPLLAELRTAGELTSDALAVLARVPLLSLRTQLRQICGDADPDLAIRAALALAGQQDSAGLAGLVRALTTAPTEECAHAVARMPARALQPLTQTLRAAMQVDDVMVRLWLAIALAKAYDSGTKTGDLEPLEQLWDSLVRSGNAPPLFWGDPWVAEHALSAMRPLPELTRNFLLGLKINDFDGWSPRSDDIVDPRNAKILIAGLTGDYDIDGEPRLSVEDAPRSGPRSAPVAVQALRQFLQNPWRDSSLNIASEARVHLSVAPPELAAESLERALQTAPQLAAAAHEGGMLFLNNAVLDLATALPANIPLRVSTVLRNPAIKAGVPRIALTWAMGRAGPDRLWDSLAPELLAAGSSDRHEWLVWLRDISAQIDTPAPYQGSGGDPGSTPPAQLIDDMPKAAMRDGSARAMPPRPPPSMAAMGEAAGSAPPAAPASKPQTQPEPPAAARYIQGTLYRQDGDAWEVVSGTLLARHRHRLDALIGPAGVASIQSETAFPDQALDWRSVESLSLQLVCTVLDGRRDASVATIELPRSGRSTTGSFEFVPSKIGPLRIRIAVLHMGRILQTAIFEVFVVENFHANASGIGDKEPRPEMMVHSDLSTLPERRPYGASLLLNHTLDEKATATAASGNSAYVSSLDEAQAQLSAISALLQEIANKSKIHTRKFRSPENAEWLARLAREGHYLYRNLVLDYIEESPAAEQLRDARYLQIVTARPDAVVPLEFVYEYGYPAKTAQICAGAEQALADGKCAANCALKQDPDNHVCPLGFWGLNRVIERHAHDPSLQAPAVVTGVESNPGRKQLVLRGPSLLAASNQVPKERVEALGERLAKFSRAGVSHVGNWKAWLKAIDTQPILFVVLPHAAGTGPDIALEINGDLLESARIERRYVYPKGSQGSPPIVLLLGCNTAGVAEMNTYAKHITVFRQAQCAIVLATTAAVVWGADIAEVAEQLIAQLQAAAEKPDACFGDILREAKCKAVLDSQLVAICLAGIGDADWRISIPTDS
jgi:hypothetical protein